MAAVEPAAVVATAGVAAGGGSSGRRQTARETRAASRHAPVSLYMPSRSLAGSTGDQSGWPVPPGVVQAPLHELRASKPDAHGLCHGVLLLEAMIEHQDGAARRPPGCRCRSARRPGASPAAPQHPRTRSSVASSGVPGRRARSRIPCRAAPRRGGSSSGRGSIGSRRSSTIPPPAALNAARWSADGCPPVSHGREQLARVGDAAQGLDRCRHAGNSRAASPR